jgi:hypothetical protein
MTGTFTLSVQTLSPLNKNQKDGEIFPTWNFAAYKSLAYVYNGTESLVSFLSTRNLDTNECFILKNDFFWLFSGLPSERSKANTIPSRRRQLTDPERNEKKKKKGNLGNEQENRFDRSDSRYN